MNRTRPGSERDCQLDRLAARRRAVTSDDLDRGLDGRGRRDGRDHRAVADDAQADDAREHGVGQAVADDPIVQRDVRVGPRRVVLLRAFDGDIERRRSCARRLRRISTTSHAAHAPAPASSSSVAEKPVELRVSVSARGALMAIGCVVVRAERRESAGLFVP